MGFLTRSLKQGLFASFANAAILRCAASGCEKSAVRHRVLRRDGISLANEWLCSAACFRLALFSAIDYVPSATVPPSTLHVGRVPFRFYLLRAGVASERQLSEAALWAQRQGVPLADALLELGTVTQAQLGAALAEEAGCGFCAQPISSTIDTKQQLPAHLARQFGAVVIHSNQERLLLGFIRKPVATVARALSAMSGMRVESCIVIAEIWQSFQPEQGSFVPTMRSHFSTEELLDNLVDAALGHRAEEVRVARIGEIAWARFWNEDGHALDVISQSRTKSIVRHFPQKKVHVL